MDKPAAVNKQLLSRLTHHVRNPFNGIIGFADLLINHFEKLTDDDVKKHMGVILQLSKKALLRSENLSWWLKFYTGNLTPIFQDTDVSEIIKDELNYFAPEISKQDLEITQHNVNRTVIYVDKVMMQAIIRNAIANVIEFAVPGSEVDLELTKVKGKVQVRISNQFKDDPTEETIAFIKNFAENDTKTEQMPDNPGLWCIKALGSVLNLRPELEFHGKKSQLTLTLN